jgi:hypothetical protein
MGARELRLQGVAHHGILHRFATITTNSSQETEAMWLTAGHQETAIFISRAVKEFMRSVS